MFDRQILRLDGIRPMLALCLVLALLKACLIVGQAFALSDAIVRIWEGRPLDGAIDSLALFAVCFIGREIVGVCQQRAAESYAQNAIAALEKKLLCHLYDEGVSLVEACGTASLVSDLVEGMAAVERYIERIIPRTILMIVIPIVIAVAVCTQDVISGVIIVVCYPFIIMFMRLIGYTASDESAKRHEGFTQMAGHFLDSLRGMETLRAFGIAKGYAVSIYAASERYRKLIMKTLRIAQLSGAVLDVFATCGLAAVAIMLGFRMVEGALAFYPALVVLMLVPEYFMPIKTYASDYHTSLDGKTALASIMDALAIKRRCVVWDGTPVRVGRGTKVAVMGKTGAGKTTLLDAVAGLVDAQGDIEVCGLRAGQFVDEAWTRRIAYIPQNPHVFAASLRHNVSFYRSDATDEEIEAALERVGLGSLVRELPDGIDTLVGDGGRALSGGEAHRLALARVLIDRSRDVWLLDEPGSSLDIQTEYDLKRELVPLMEGKTVLISTHRSHWRDAVDEVLHV